MINNNYIKDFNVYMDMILYEDVAQSGNNEIHNRLLPGENWEDSICTSTLTEISTGKNNTALKQLDLNWTLNYACLLGNLSQVKKLIKRGACIGSVAPLSIAINKGHIEMVEYLLSIGIDPRGGGNLFSAIKSRKKQIAFLLQSYGAELENTEINYLLKHRIPFQEYLYNSAYRKAFRVPNKI